MRNASMRTTLRPLRRLDRESSRVLRNNTISSYHPLPPQWLRARNFSSSIRQRDDTKQVPDFPGYAYDSLNDTLALLRPAVAKSTPSPPPTAAASPSPSTEAEQEELSSASRAALVFGPLRSASTERRETIAKNSTLIAGVLVPPKPEEPENCCMSGCVNCVWEEYREDFEEWSARRRESEIKLKEARRGEGGGSEGVGVGMDGDGVEKDGEGQDDVWRDIPPGIREFVEMEKRLKERQRGEGGG